MRIDHDPSTGKPTTREEVDGILRSRLELLGLDVDATGRDFREAFDKIKTNCASCCEREVCALDLKRDPEGSMWEAYCPNSEGLNAIVAVSERIP
jgi:hypothetical protein